MTDLQLDLSHESDTSPDPAPAYVARPVGSGPWPGVVVIHDANGMGRSARRQADWLASEGYLAIAPNLFSPHNVGRCMWVVFNNIRSGRGAYFDQVNAARASLAADATCTGRVGVIGVCMGGGFALALAPEHDLDAEGGRSGVLPDDAELTLAAACPIMGHGGKDRSQGAAHQLNRVLDMLGISRGAAQQAEAGEGLLNDHRDDVVPWYHALVTRFVGGADYHEPSAADARQRISAFFGRHLGDTGSPAGVA